MKKWREAADLNLAVQGANLKLITKLSVLSFLTAMLFCNPLTRNKNIGGESSSVIRMAPSRPRLKECPGKELILMILKACLNWEPPMDNSTQQNLTNSSSATWIGILETAIADRQP